MTDDLSTTSTAPVVRFERVVLVHGFGANIEAHWFPWLATQVPGLERIVLPSPTAPTASSWVPLIRDTIGALEPSTAVVTHSLGGIAAALAIGELADATGQLGALVSVAPFATPIPLLGFEDLDTFLATEFQTFLASYDPAVVRKALVRSTVIRSDDDPIVPPVASDAFAHDLHADLVEVAGAGHFLDEGGITTLPPVIAALARAER